MFFRQTVSFYCLQLALKICGIEAVLPVSVNGSLLLIYFILRFWFGKRWRIPNHFFIFC
jgi:hypothetical protein